MPGQKSLMVEVSIVETSCRCCAVARSSLPCVLTMSLVGSVKAKGIAMGFIRENRKELIKKIANSEHPVIAGVAIFLITLLCVGIFRNLGTYLDQIGFHRQRIWIAEMYSQGYLSPILLVSIIAICLAVYLLRKAWSAIWRPDGK